ncbi:hypothetical protein C4D60_Mb09t21650 [Musa balbisiana]|uniref:Uncharacterized protein n=1 Tax=Musa balbisiana TaxID=52838 RepID=A0A4S8IJG2_MUSBA|nr:hypothetical protein C4D60_Mb09t21650 [Musa balbisiana]
MSVDMAYCYHLSRRALGLDDGVEKRGAGEEQGGEALDEIVGTMPNFPMPERRQSQGRPGKGRCSTGASPAPGTGRADSGPFRARLPSRTFSPAHEQEGRKECKIGADAKFK